jgi:hypothetical protein
MPFNHRGDFVAPNHRPTPRLAQILSTRMGNDAQATVWRTAPNLYRASAGPSIEESQAALDNYRSQRDFLGDKDNPDADLSAHADLAQTKNYINETLKFERTGENFKPTKSYKDMPNF